MAGNTRFQGEVVVVTGGSRGIGLGTARAFAEEGAAVAVGARDAQAAERAAEEIGRGAMGFALDVADEASVAHFFAQVRETLGPVDVLVNNAGVCPTVEFEDIHSDEWDAVLAVNLKGVYLASREAMEDFKKRKKGAIVNLASIAGQVGGLVVPPHYAASKAGVLCLTKSLAHYLASHGVRVNAVAPANIETDMTDAWPEEKKELMRTMCPFHRFGRVGETTRTILFLASEEASYITGETINVNGGIFMD
ncbi:MAG: SDR family NAD(P)-dependent oxidoreductase [Nitrospinota bacterium]|nr:SDR family NAD(P)-dependent oxidoreductase [Nitrospinota bacterium]MDP7371614.1 SDR family NAD(P)-dependent oxidoreductase [Nitrospinota bacterium]HJP14345.1 SDR family NAD(P)-dependent oxidoreductase [Nitrospinota bacterium]